MATTKQLGMIHGLAKRRGLEEELYRDFLQQQTGKRSAKDLDTGEAARLIDTMLGMSGERASGAVAGLDTPIGRKLRALWIAAYSLHLVRDRTDKAMLSFLERQTGVSHTRFLKHPADAKSAIEALKVWLARDGGVEWPTGDDAIEQKHAVLNAQWMKLVELGEVDRPIGPLADLRHYALKVCRMSLRGGWEQLESHHYDTVQQALGRKLRGALARVQERSQQEGKAS